MKRFPAEVSTPGPLLGGHNEQLLGELLGIPDHEITRLTSSGVTAALSTGLHQGPQEDQSIQGIGIH